MAPLQHQLAHTTLRGVIKSCTFPWKSCWCAYADTAYPLSLRHLEEMMAERGVSVDHATVHSWALKILPVLAAAFAGASA